MRNNKLFDHIYKEHRIALTQSELIDIISICNAWTSIEDEYPEPDQTCLFYSGLYNGNHLYSCDSLDKDEDFDGYFHSYAVTHFKLVNPPE